MKKTYEHCIINNVELLNSLAKFALSSLYAPSPVLDRKLIEDRNNIQCINAFSKYPAQ